MNAESDAEIFIRSVSPAGTPRRRSSATPHKKVPRTGTEMAEISASVHLPVEYLVELLITHHKRQVMRRDRLGVEEARQPVVLGGEAGPLVEVPLGREDFLPERHHVVAGHGDAVERTE